MKIWPDLANAHFVTEGAGYGAAIRRTQDARNCSIATSAFADSGHHEFAQLMFVDDRYL